MVGRKNAVVLLVGLVLVAGGVAGCGSGSEPDPSPEPSTATRADLDGDFASVRVEGRTLPDESQLRILFAQDRLSANLGCNAISGGYRFAEGEIRTGVLMMTQMGCSDEFSKADQWLYRFLSDPLRAEVSGDELILSDGDVTVTLEPES